MTRVTGLVVLLSLLTVQGCIASSVVLHVSADGHFDLSGFSAQPLISFAMKPHDNGDRLLLVRLPDERLDPGPEPEMTVFATDSREKQMFKRAIQKMPRQTQPPATSPPSAPQAPPDTDIFLAPLKVTNGAVEVGTPVNITGSPGYDNQPFFTPDGRTVLFTSMRGGTQTDIYKYEIAAKRVSQVTSTPESEYSPTITPKGALSVIRVELDGPNTQRLWQFSAEGRDPTVILQEVKPVGYHAWADDHTLALFVLGQPATLQLADTRTGAARAIASDIGRSIQRIPGTGPISDISFVQRERDGEVVKLTVKRLNPANGEVSVLSPAVEGSREADTAWMPDGTLLMAKDGILHSWKRGQTGWKESTSFERLGLTGVTRLAVSPAGDYLAIVGSSR